MQGGSNCRGSLLSAKKNIADASQRRGGKGVKIKSYRKWQKKKKGEKKKRETNRVIFNTSHWGKQELSGGKKKSYGHPKGGRKSHLAGP